MAPQMITIRQVAEKDLASLLELLEAKATFDGVRPTLRATVASLRMELFGTNPIAHAIVAVESDAVLGMATYFTTFSSFLMKPGLWLDDLYVRESFRGKGIGREMMKWLSRHASQRGAARIDWVVATLNEDGHGFYKSLGATIFESVRLARLGEDEIRVLATEDA